MFKQKPLFIIIYTISADWLSSAIGETTLHNSYVLRVTYMATTDQLDVSATIGYESLLGFDIVVDKTSETVGLVQNDGFTATSYYPIYLEDARKEPSQKRMQIAKKLKPQKKVAKVKRVEKKHRGFSQCSWNQPTHQCIRNRCFIQ